MNNNEKIAYFGPFFPPNFGPNIKNTIISDELKNYFNIDLFNSSKKMQIIKFLFMSIFYKNIIIAVSKKGRFLINPYIYILKKIIKNKIIFMPMGGTLAQEIDNKFYGKIYKKIYKNFDIIYVETKGLKKELRSFGLDNVKVFPNVKNIVNDEYKSPYKFRYNLIYISRVREIKGIFDIIEAVIGINEEGIPLRLYIYGSIEETTKQKFYNLIKNKNFIIYKGEVLYTEIGKIIKNKGIFVFPSKAQSEGFPGAFIDAFEFGLPIISTDIAYNKEIIKNRVNGLIYKSSNVEELKLCIKKLIYDKNLYNFISKNNFNARKKYDVKLRIKDIVKEIDEDAHTKRKVYQK